jgi:hypothetical protein
MLRRWFSSAEHETLLSSTAARDAMIEITGPVVQETLGQDLFDVFIAFVLVEWIVILLGLQESAEPRPGAVRTRDMILQTVAGQLLAKRRARLLALWRRQQQLLRGLHDPLRKYNRAVARTVGVRRGIIAQMSDQFYKFHISCEEGGR